MRVSTVFGRPVFGCLVSVCLCLAITLVGPAYAASPPAASDSPPAPSASQMEAARQLVLLSGISRSFTIFVPQLDQQITQMIAQTRPELSGDLETVMKQLRPEFESHQRDILDQTAEIYCYQLSEAEMKEAIAFFGSPAGKKYVNVEPVVLGQMVTAIHDWSLQLSQTMLTRVREEMKKKGHPI